MTDRKTRRSIKKANMASAELSEKLDAAYKDFAKTKEKLEKDIETQKQAISQLEAITEVSSKSPLPHLPLRLKTHQ